MFWVVLSAIEELKQGESMGSDSGFLIRYQEKSHETVIFEQRSAGGDRKGPAGGWGMSAPARGIPNEKALDV